MHNPRTPPSRKHIQVRVGGGKLQRRSSLRDGLSASLHGTSSTPAESPKTPRVRRTPKRQMRIDRLSVSDHHHCYPGPSSPPPALSTGTSTSSNTTARNSSRVTRRTSGTLRRSSFHGTLPLPSTPSSPRRRSSTSRKDMKKLLSTAGLPRMAAVSSGSSPTTTTDINNNKSKNYSKKKKKDNQQKQRSTTSIERRAGGGGGGDALDKRNDDEFLPSIDDWNFSSVNFGLSESSLPKKFDESSSPATRNTSPRKKSSLPIMMVVKNSKTDASNNRPKSMVF